MKKLKHLIIGSGVIGSATGIWLKANNEEIIFCDIKPEILKKLEIKGFKVTTKIENIKADMFWICTAEWNTEEVLKKLSKHYKDPFVLIRSTTPPGTVEKLGKKYNIRHIAHIPEFLKQKTAIQDIFDKDRIIIGTTDKETQEKLKQVFNSETIKIIYTTPTTSELIKYASNCWLAMTISYWNEIKKICDKYKVNPQMVANAACLDRRISKYGTAMIGEPYAGFCFPKDLDAFIKSFEENKIDSTLLKAVRKVNDLLKKQKKGEE